MCLDSVSGFGPIFRSLARDVATAEELVSWFDRSAASYGTLPMNAANFGERVPLKHGKPSTRIEGTTIAAMATVRRLTVATRNVRDLCVFGVYAFDPFDTDERAERRAHDEDLANLLATDAPTTDTDHAESATHNGPIPRRAPTTVVHCLCDNRKRPDGTVARLTGFSRC